MARPNHKNPLNFFRNGTKTGKIEGFSAQIVANEFATWLKDIRKAEEPFFVTIWLHEPHGPIESDPEFIKKYKKYNDPSLQQYYANITQIDEAVGSIVQALKEANAYEDTLIWYTSDNGPEGRDGFGTYNQSDSYLGQSRYRGSTGGLRGRKRHTHEGGIRVPNLISWPAGMKKAKVKPGFVSATPIIGSDIFPTFLDIAGVPLPEGVTMDSTSIRPILEREAFSRERPLYWRNTKGEFVIALREGPWKIIGNSMRDKFELYHLVEDPFEVHNYAEQEPQVFERLKSALIAYDKEVLKEGPKWWQHEKNLKNKIPLED